MVRYTPPGMAISAAWLPDSMMTPASMTTMVVAARRVERRCATMREVGGRPPARPPDSTVSIAACTSRSDWLSSADVASSNAQMRGWRMMARAMATRCFWPPDSLVEPMSVS